VPAAYVYWEKLSLRVEIEKLRAVIGNNEIKHHKEIFLRLDPEKEDL
jgi:hypothetical protein